MFQELVGQVQRLFSSKRNGGRLVYNLTDTLHYYKQVLLATSIILLLGYSQFRPHFECQGFNNVDKRSLTNFCWINGTTTIDLRDEGLAKASRASSMPHVGIHFRLNEGKYELINHNYMRSLWMLLILMAVCSFIAQRRWALIFQHDILRALLKLPGHESLTLVSRAKEANAYQALIQLPASSKKQEQQIDLVGLLKESELFHSIEIITGEQNEYNRTLDYYPNQLIYLLLARQTSAYKLTGLKLRRKLIIHSISSFSLTLMQFILPYMFIGDKYKLYGFNFLKSWLRYTLKQLMRPNSVVNSIDYGLSSRIWPTLTQCEYKEYGYQGYESITVQCTVSINEICGKLFVVIWWFVAINILIESYSLIGTLFCSLNFLTSKWSFGQKAWPHVKREAQFIASFRYKHAQLARELNLGSENGAKKVTKGGQEIEKSSDEEEDKRSAGKSERERKQLEAEANRTASRASLADKRWYLWCPRDIGVFLAEKGKKWGEKPSKLMKAKKNRTLKDEDGFRERKEDLEIYYLLYLLFLRLNRSEKKIEQIIKMTSNALGKYLDNLSNLGGELKELKNKSIRREDGDQERTYGQNTTLAGGQTNAADTIIDVAG